MCFRRANESFPPTFLDRPRHICVTSLGRLPRVLLFSLVEKRDRVGAIFAFGRGYVNGGVRAASSVEVLGALAGGSEGFVFFLGRFLAGCFVTSGWPFRNGSLRSLTFLPGHHISAHWP